MKSMLLAVLLSSICLNAQAAWNNPKNVSEEQKIIKDYALKSFKGYQLAGDYTQYYDSTPRTDEDKKSSYVFFDMNQDGGQDLAIILEKLTCEDRTIKKLEECNYIATTQRVVAIFFGQWNGTYKRVGYNRSAMLEKGEGGAASPYGDPLMPIGVDQSDNSLQIYFFGGSNTKWSYQFNIKYRKVAGKGWGFYLVRKEMMSQELKAVGESMELTEYNQTYDYEKDVVFQTIKTYDLDAGGITYQANDSFFEELELKSFSHLGPSDFYSDWY